MEKVMTSAAITHAKLQSNRHHQQTNTRISTGWMPFLSPNQQCHGTEWKGLIMMMMMMVILEDQSSFGCPSKQNVC